jgi:hypothetical protein
MTGPFAQSGWMLHNLHYRKCHDGKRVSKPDGCRLVVGSLGDDIVYFAAIAASNSCESSDGIAELAESRPFRVMIAVAPTARAASCSTASS